jgi:septal ring factor EnvC (AmiA/AmiB activator)
MQLEKSHSGEAGLIGWISSNDVTLLTMVLVVVIALFLHVTVIKGRIQNKQMQEELTQTESDLETREQELYQTTGQLQQTEGKLDDVSARREVLDDYVVDVLRRIDAITADKNRMEAKLKDDLKTTRETLTAELNSTQGALRSERLTTADLTKARDILAQDTATLKQKLAALVASLEEKVEALGDAKQQRDRLKEQADTLDTIVAQLQNKLNLADDDMEKLKAAHAQQLALARTQMGNLQETADSEKARAEDYLTRLRNAADWFKKLQSEKNGLQTEVTDLEQRYEQQVAREAIVSRQLVGVQGTMRRVAFLFDASGSMKDRGTGTDDRWREAQKIATTWLAHLDVDECVLIVFSSNVITVPTDGSFIRVSGPEGEANRSRLMAQLNSVEPRGRTNTLAAFQKAYEYEGLDTIILFSDGAPSNSNSGQFDAYMAQEIYALCGKHTDIPVNAIGLGNYFDQNMATFLRNVARITGGTFRGR